jgi:hypothetical protein
MKIARSWKPTTTFLFRLLRGQHEYVFNEAARPDAFQRSMDRHVE